MLVCWTVIRTQKCLERRFVLSALLIVFHCIIWLLIAFHFISLHIAFSKKLLENDFLKEKCLKQPFYYHTKLANENISTCCFSSNRFKTVYKLIITSSVTKGVYIRPCILLIRWHMQYARLKSGLFASTFVLGNSIF